MIKQIIGVVPQSCGEYDPNREGGYDKAERVLLYNCEWESEFDGNTYVPATIDEEGNIIPGTHWLHVSGSLYITPVITTGEIDELLSE